MSLGRVAITVAVAGATMVSMPGPSDAQSATVPSDRVVLPIEGFYERQSVKTFGTVVDQAFLAGRPDLFRDNGYPKFTGHHAAVDVEYAALSEQGSVTPVRAMAAGTVIYKGTVTGYGGVIVIRHERPEAVTSLYGHVRVSDAPVAVGQGVTAGQVIANLGTPYGPETGGERKHLHFGIHKGTALDLNGHEPTRAVLDAEWDNPNDWLRQHGAVATLESPGPSPRLASSPSTFGEPVMESSSAPEPARGFFSRVWHALTDWL